MSLSYKDALRLATGDVLPVVRATSNHLAVAYPLQAESGLRHPLTGEKVPGIPVGYCGQDRSGGMFSFDEWQLYQAGVLHNTNVKTLGKIDHHKSGDRKVYIKRGIRVGYNHLVTDLKGEYTALAETIPNARVLRFGQDTNLFINPLDNAMDLDTQYELVTALALTALGQGHGQTELDTVQGSLLWSNIQHVHDGRTTATLPDLVEGLLHPPDVVQEDMGRSEEIVMEQGYKLALALKKLTTGSLRGMFHKATTPGLLEETPLLVLNCEGLKGQKAVAMITLINFFTQSQWAGKNPKHRFHKIIHDESWELAAYPGFVESIRRAFKLGGTWGVANYIVAHHMSDLFKSGHDEAINSLIADSDTSIIYRQEPDEIEASADVLKLTESEVRRTTQLPPGRALYKIADLQAIEVEHYTWPEEMSFVQTRAKLMGQENYASA